MDATSKTVQTNYRARLFIMLRNENITPHFVLFYSYILLSPPPYVKDVLTCGVKPKFRLEANDSPSPPTTKALITSQPSFLLSLSHF